MYWKGAATTGTGGEQGYKTFEVSPVVLYNTGSAAKYTDVLVEAMPDATAADVVRRLRGIYSSTIGFDLDHIEEEVERDWFRKVIEGGDARLTLTSEEKKAVLKRLTEVDGLERFLARAYVGEEAS